MALNPRFVQADREVIWIVGASTGIGQALAERLAGQGASVVVSARNAVPLESFQARYPAGMAVPLDVTDAAAVRAACEAIVARYGRLDRVLFCAGVYRALRATGYDLGQMLQHQQVNYVGALNLLAPVIPLFLFQGQGHISLVSSVAGFSGLPQGLAYGPTKAALTHLAETLFLDLRPKGLGVSVVHPGFVETPLTRQNEFPMPFLQTPQQAAEAIERGWRRGQFEIHFPRRFSLILKALRLLPYRWYFALVHKGTGL